MKKLFLIVLITILIVVISKFVFAQTPQAFKYQAVARDNAGKILNAQTISVRASIIRTSISGTSAYTETHSVTTNQFGMFSLNIGEGVVISGDFATIGWGNDKYFLKIQLKLPTSDDYLLMGTTQLLSVPYALHSASSESLILTDAKGKKWGVVVDSTGKLTTECLPKVTTANAGNDQLEIDGLTATLEGNAPGLGTIVNGTGETGVWTIITGTGGVITTPTNPTSTFTGKAGRTYKLLWTLTNDCGSSSDYVTISFKGNMVFVQGGTFMMGDDNGTKWEKPAHLVTLSSYWISKFELTQAEYVDVIGTNPSAFKNDNNPVETVSWWDAVKYCNKRSMIEGLTVCYSYNNDTMPDNWIDSPMDDSKIVCNWSAKGYRLPTEAEWEFAAKGGVKSIGYINHNYYTYSGSNNPLEVAWFTDDTDKPKTSTTVVGTLKANELGLYDMSGNVYELCWDWWSDTYISNNPVSNPTGPLTGTLRDMRGDSFAQSDLNKLRLTYRLRTSSASRVSNMGFRISKTN
ncbi:MAG: SUMF1/EgtB/PvdO family nonheme iron enzyme [Candidatus Absconditabacterales bacterium]|jgi:formylglycine-generating enzyme required for sulfatase activity